MKKLIISLLCLVACSSGGGGGGPTPEPPLPERGALGHDLLALLHPQFPVPYILEEIPDNFVGGHLDWTFGEDTRNLDALLGSGKVKAWRVHVFNGPCIRNRNCGPYEPVAGESIESFDADWRAGGGGYATHLANRVKLYCDKIPASIKLYISPTLEHNLSDQAFDQQAAIVRANCPRALVVHNAVADGRYRAEYINESHNRQNNAPDGALFSYDGNEAMDSNVPADLQRLRERSALFLVWSWVYNGRCTKGGFVDPRSRTRWPNRAMVADLFSLSSPLPPPPPSASPIVGPSIWKPWADDECDGNPRANKPVYLTRYRGSDIKILGNNDTVLQTIPYGGRFSHDQSIHLYRSSIHASEITQKALALTGSPWVYLLEGGQKFGPFIASYRQGTFR